ncbi:Protein PAT1 1 [Chamberlinius hualienensis]
MAKSYLTSKLGYNALRGDLSNMTGRSTEEDDKYSEDEYDALNDETFGLDPTGGDLDEWEEGQEHYAQLDEHFGNGNVNAHEVNANTSHQETSRKSDKLQTHEFYNNFGEGDGNDTNNIEDSLNQLVLDDEVKDPAIVGIHPAPLYERRSFSPPPPAIVESNHVGSPSAKSIWSTSMSEANNVFRGNLFGPFRTASPLYYDLPRLETSVISSGGNDRSFTTQSSTVAKLMPNAKTLEEIEKELLNSQKTAAAVEETSKEVLRMQGALTVGELEKKLSIGSDKAKSTPKKPIGPPPGFGNRASYARKPDMSTPFNPLSPCVVTPSIGIPGARIAGSPSQMSKSMSPTSSVVCNTKPSPLIRPIHLQPLRPNVIIPPQLPHPAAFRASPFIGQYAAGRPLMLGQVPYPSPYNPMPLVIGFQDKRDAMSNYSRLSSSVHQFSQRVNVKGGYGHNGWNPSREESHINAASDVDEYADLMSKKEKEWLINIQMIQLQSDNPYLDDYYYTNFMLKKRVKETKEKEPTLVIPERSKVVETKTYKPVQYEGSLGKLQAGSVTCPRKMIDVHCVHTDDTENDTHKLANRETKKLRQLLLDIEKLYVCVLQADDIDKRVAVLPEEARLPLYEFKKEVIGKLYNGFIQNVGLFFVHMVGVRKGRNLVARSILLFSENQLKVLFTIIFTNFSVILKKDITGQMGAAIYEHFKSFLKTCNLETLLWFGEKLCNEFDENSGKSHCRVALEHRVGVAFVCDIFCRAEEIYVQNPPKNTDLRRHWEEVMSSAIECLENVSLPVDNKFIPNKNFVDHLHRFSAKNSIVILVNDWINTLKASSQKTII